MYSDYLYNVMTKRVIVNLRVKPEIRDEFTIAAELRGATMSGLLHQFIVKTIREEKEREPDAFKNPVLAEDKGEVDIDSQGKQKKAS